MTTTEQGVAQVELSQERSELLRHALSAVAIAHSGQVRAEGQLAAATNMVEVATAMEQRAIEDREIAERQTDQARYDAETTLGSILKSSDVSTSDVLDIWYAYRRDYHYAGGSHFGKNEAVEADERDREAFDRIQPGVTIMNLSAASGKLPMVDTVVDHPKLESENVRNNLALTVVFETEGSQNAPKERSVPGVFYPRYKYPGVRHDLEGLARTLLVGEEAIHDYLANFTPTLVSRKDLYEGNYQPMHEASKALRYLDVLENSHLKDANQPAIDTLREALVANCRTIIGLTDPTNPQGNNEDHRAVDFLQAVNRHMPEAYQTIYDEIARIVHHRTYRFPDSYTILVAMVEHSRPNFRMDLQTKAEVLAQLTARAQELDAAKQSTTE